MALSKRDMDDFQSYSVGVKEILSKLLSENPIKFDNYVLSLSDEEKKYLMHADELEAAAITLGKRTSDLISENNNLLEGYSALEEKWQKKTQTETFDITASDFPEQKSYNELLDEISSWKDYHRNVKSTIDSALNDIESLSRRINNTRVQEELEVIREGLLSVRDEK
jgi:hypothetical protein